MSDVAKWALLLAGIVVIIGLILSLDIIDFIDLSVFNNAISTLVEFLGNGFRFGRGIINNLLSPWARKALSGLMIWLIGKEFVIWTIKASVWAYHYIFK